MDNEFGLQRPEIPKLTEETRQKIVQHQDKEYRDKYRVIEDAFAKLKAMMEAWEVSWLRRPGRPLRKQLLDNSPRPHRLWIEGSGVVTVSESYRGYKSLVATDQLPVFKVIADLTKKPNHNYNLDSTFTLGVPFADLEL